MITRYYFYLIDTQEINSKFGHGIVSTKSLFADPIKARKSAIKCFCESTGKNEGVCKMISFNRV